MNAKMLKKQPKTKEAFDFLSYYSKLKNDEKGNGGKQFSPSVVFCWQEDWKERRRYEPLAPEFSGYSSKPTSETFRRKAKMLRLPVINEQ